MCGIRSGFQTGQNVHDSLAVRCYIHSAAGGENWAKQTPSFTWQRCHQYEIEASSKQNEVLSSIMIRCSSLTLSFSCHHRSEVARRLCFHLCLSVSISSTAKLIQLGHDGLELNTFGKWSSVWVGFFT